MDEEKLSRTDKVAIFEFLEDVDEVFLIMSSGNSILLPSIEVDKYLSSSFIKSEIPELMQKRDEARAKKDFITSDRLRDLLFKKGIELQDTPYGTIIEKLYIDFGIHFNWPFGTNSFVGFENSKRIQQMQIKTKVLAKNIQDDRYRTFDESRNEPLELSIFNDISSHKGKLSGDIFIIEIYDRDNKFLKAVKIDAVKEKPSNAFGNTSVDRNYSLEIF